MVYRVQVAGLKEQLEVEKQGNWDLENTRTTLEQEKESLTRQLVAMEEEVTQNKYNIKRVTTELEQALKQTAAVLAEKGHALLQVTQSNSQLEKVRSIVASGCNYRLLSNNEGG